MTGSKPGVTVPTGSQWSKSGDVSRCEVFPGVPERENSRFPGAPSRGLPRMGGDSGSGSTEKRIGVSALQALVPSSWACACNQTVVRPGAEKPRLWCWWAPIGSPKRSLSVSPSRLCTVNAKPPVPSNCQTQTWAGPSIRRTNRSITCGFKSRPSVLRPKYKSPGSWLAGSTHSGEPTGPRVSKPGGMVSWAASGTRITV